MLNSIFGKSLRDLVRPLLWWALGLGLFSLWTITLFPSIKENSGFAELIETMPESLMVMFGEITTISTLEGFLSIELFNFFIPMLLLAFGLAFAGGSISQEEESGTLDLLLSSPIPRWRVVIEKFAALAVFILLVLAVIYLSLIVGAALADISTEGVPMLGGVLNMFPLTLFFVALALMITAVGGSRGLAVGLSGGLAAATYLINTMHSLTDLPEWVRKLSPWWYYGGERVLTDGIQWGYFSLLLGLALLFVAIGTYVFSQRDLGT